MMNNLLIPITKEQKDEIALIGKNMRVLRLILLGKILFHKDFFYQMIEGKFYKLEMGKDKKLSFQPKDELKWSLADFIALFSDINDFEIFVLESEIVFWGGLVS